MNDYLDITASELLKELDHFFLIDTHDGTKTGFWVNEQALTDKHYWIDSEYKVEILRALQPAHQNAPHNYKITRLAPSEDEGNVVLLEYDGIRKKILTFRRGEWVNRLCKYFYQKERYYLQQLNDNPNFQTIEY